MSVPAKLQFTCPLCSKSSVTIVDVPEINWAASDKLSDLISEAQVTVDCSSCAAEFDAYVQNTPSMCTVTLDEYPKVKISVDASLTPNENDDWLNIDVPADPLSVFTNSYYHVRDILFEYGAGGAGSLSHSAHVIHRMVFVQQISALEAYLSDTLVNQVMDHAHVLDALLNGDNELREMKVSLVAISKDPEIVKVTAKKHLQSILYHNLSKVAVLYSIALQVNIWPDEKTKKDLFIAVSERHDYVHRNGRDKDGRELSPLTRDDVEKLIDTMLRLVNHIESQISASTR